MLNALLVILFLLTIIVGVLLYFTYFMIKDLKSLIGTLKNNEEKK